MSDETFDYVVVGGGSGGSIVASRLSAAGAKVLLLEAGTTDRRHLEILIPAGVAVAYARSNWKYPAEPDPSRSNRPEAWMAGKVMGGGGSINSCVFVRGNRADYDGWAKDGCTGWDYDSVLPAFKRLETWAGGENEFRGGSGPISVAVQSNHGQANMSFLEAAKQAGYPETPDYNGATQDGAALAQVNHRRGTRSSASREYIKRVASKQLTVRTKAMATRVLLEGTRAVGVEYLHKGELKQARARQEIVLSAGTMGSAKLLLLSGIGGRLQLSEHGLDVTHELPGVGENLHEHAFLMQRYHAKIHTFNKPRIGDVLGAVKDYALHGTGVLAMTMVQVQVMAKTDATLESPDVQLQFTPIAITRDVDENGMFNVQPAKEEGFLASSTFTHTRYRGRVSLRSANPTDNPRIEMQLLGHPDDLRDTLRGMRMVQEIMEQPAMREISADHFSPESECRTDADWEAYARNYAVPSYHPVGTCRMGIDDLAVVDPQLRVHGLQGLRVVDASVMPTVTTGNTNAPTMMIGERGAEFLLASA